MDKNKVVTMSRVTVKRQENSKQFGIYVDGKLVEGGFFTKLGALCVAYDYVKKPEVK